MYVAIYILIVSLVIFTSYRMPSIVFGFMLCTFSLEQWLQSKDVFFLIHGSLINLSSGFLVLIGLIFYQINKNGEVKFYPPMARLVIALYVYASVSVLWSPVTDISVSNLQHYMPYIFLYVLLAPLLINNEEDAYEAFKFLIIFGGILALLLLLFTEWGYRRIVMAAEMVDLRANPLAIADMAGYVLFASILLNFKKEYKFWRFLKWLIVIICLGVAVKTGSRGQFILMILLSIFFLPISRPINHIKRLVPLVFAGIVIAGGSYWAMKEYTSDYTAKEGARWEVDRMGDDLSGRFDAAISLIGEWYSSPSHLLFGLGSSASYDESIAGFYTHIVPLEILGELGLIGFLIFIIIMVKAYYIFRNCLKMSKGSLLNRGVLATTGAILMFEFFLSFKQGSFLASQVLFCMLVVLSKLEEVFSKDKSYFDDEVKNQDLFQSGCAYTGVKLRVVSERRNRK